GSRTLGSARRRRDSFGRAGDASTGGRARRADRASPSRPFPAAAAFRSRADRILGGIDPRARRAPAALGTASSRASRRVRDSRRGAALARGGGGEARRSAGAGARDLEPRGARN